MISYITKFFKCTTPMLGRWSLKHRCVITEEIAVFNANRDHCGDSICGNPEEYKKMVPKHKDLGGTTTKK